MYCTYCRYSRSHYQVLALVNHLPSKIRWICYHGRIYVDNKVNIQVFAIVMTRFSTKIKI